MLARLKFKFPVKKNVKREVKEHAGLNIINVCRVELTRVCVFHGFLKKNSPTENIVFVIVKNK